MDVLCRREPHDSHFIFFEGSHEFQLQENHGGGVVSKIDLHAGDLLAMEQWTQTELKHAIKPLPEESPERPQRINFTWRWLVRHQPECPQHSPELTVGPAELPAGHFSDEQVRANDEC